jgi:hypothetical protein
VAANPKSNYRNEAENTPSTLLPESVITELKKLTYAWNIEKALDKIEEKLVENNASNQQINQCAHSILQALQDSSQLNTVIGFINKYLMSGNLNQFLNSTQDLASTIETAANKIDFKNPSLILNALYEEEVTKINLPNAKITIEKEAQSLDGKTSPSQKTIDINSLLTNFLRQETDKISHDFRIIGSTTPLSSIDLACKDCHERLQETRHFLKDILSLRDSYKDTKEKGIKKLFRKHISQKKSDILASIEKKLAETLDQHMTLNSKEIYQALHPVLVNAHEQIDKSGNLKTMIGKIMDKYESLLPNKAPRAGLK